MAKRAARDETFAGGGSEVLQAAEAEYARQRGMTQHAADQPNTQHTAAQPHSATFSRPVAAHSLGVG